MAIVLTNGQNYVKKSNFEGEKVYKTQDTTEAEEYCNISTAREKLMSAPGKLKGYYILCTDGEGKPKHRRKIYSKEERLHIYHKYHGRCALCGKPITYEELTLDHINPLYRGGTNSLNNIQAAWFACNEFKANIKPEDFEQKIEEIFLYQTDKKHGKELRWKIVKKLLQGIM